MKKLSVLAVLCVGVITLSCTEDAPKKKSGVEIIKEEVELEEGFEAFGNEGIQIRMEREGQGEHIAMGDVVTLHYKEWLVERMRKINDTYERRSPRSIRLGSNQVVEGLEKVLAEQRVGAVFQLMVSWQLAYGPEVYKDYPPKQSVMLDVTILGVKPATPYFDTTGITPKVLNSGIAVYQVIEGNGEPARPGDGVEVHYNGYFTDGKLFDSSYDRNSPIRFELGANQVISGWEEVLVTMQVGDKVTARIPYFMAYGETGKGSIPPKADLVFDMELVAVKHLE